MPQQTVMCQECPTTIAVEVPLGHRATLTHRPTSDERISPHTLDISPMVQPISRPTQPFQPFKPSTGVENGIDT